MFERREEGKCSVSHTHTHVEAPFTLLPSPLSNKKKEREERRLGLQRRVTKVVGGGDAHDEKNEVKTKALPRETKSTKTEWGVEGGGGVPSEQAKTKEITDAPLTRKQNEIAGVTKNQKRCEGRQKKEGRTQKERARARAARRRAAA